MNKLLYGFIFFVCDHVLVKGSAMSSPIREDTAPLLLYNPSGHDIEQFEYAVKRDSERPRELDSAERGRRKEHPGSSYIRIGRSHVDGVAGDQGYGYNEAVDNFLAPKSLRTDKTIRYGRSSTKISRHKVDQDGRRFVRLGKSGSSIYTRFGRSPASPSAPSEAEVAILCPNILVDEDARGNEDLQLYLAKLMYICNNNGINPDGNNNEENNLHRKNNLEYVEDNGEMV